MIKDRFMFTAFKLTSSSASSRIEALVHCCPQRARSISHRGFCPSKESRCGLGNPAQLTLMLLLVAVAQDCESVLLRLDFKKGSSPLQGGQTEVTACVVCDEKVAALCTAKHGRSYARRRGGGRSRGRRRGRGRRAGDPLMSFRDF